MRTIAFLLLVMVAALSAVAQDIIRKKDAHPNDSIETVVIAGDTVSIVLPERNLGRFDRGLNNYIFIPKGKWGIGITASYGELSTEDLQLLSYIKDFDFHGKMYSVRPSISYFFRSNQSVGMKFNYTYGLADLASLAVDFDDDINFSLHDVSYNQRSFGAAVFYRNYIGLGRDGRFGIFNEVDLSLAGGSSRFKRYYSDELRDTHTTITDLSLNFSPGVCVFIQEWLSFNVSFGVFGLKYRHEHQLTNGIDEGTRDTSGANFRFNIFNINFGLMVVI